MASNDKVDSSFESQNKANSYNLIIRNSIFSNTQAGQLIYFDKKSSVLYNLLIEGCEVFNCQELNIRLFIDQNQFLFDLSHFGIDFATKK